MRCKTDWIARRLRLLNSGAGEAGRGVVPATHKEQDMADRRFNLSFGEAVVTVVEDGKEKPFSKIKGVEFSDLPYDKFHQLEGLTLEFLAGLHKAVAPKK